MAWIVIMPGVYAGLPDEVQVKPEAATTGDQTPSQIESLGDSMSPMDWWEFEALEHDASELA